MKRLLAALVLMLAVNSAGAASIFTSRDILNIENEPIPMKRDGGLYTPETVQQVIEGTAQEIGWATNLQAPGLLHASITVRGQYYAHVGISFTADEYSIFYISSNNLDYNEKRQSIHRAYNNWVENLSEKLKGNLRTGREFNTIALSSYLAVEGELPSTESEAIGHYFANREIDLVEGIWTWSDNTYKVAIVRNDTGIEPDYDYIGIVIRAEKGSWKAGDVKLLLNSTASYGLFTGVYFAENRQRANLSYTLENSNLLKINESFRDGQPFLIRDYPGGQIQEVPASGAVTSAGTCFVVSPSGTAVTSYHVVDDAKRILVTLTDGRQLNATVELSSVATDLAVLDLDASTPNYLSLVSTRSISVGEQVFSVGYPSVNILGAEAKFTEGSISALSGIRGEASYMQISVPLQPGNSGGPIVNFYGEVLGIVAETAAVEYFYKETGSLPQNVNWAVKSDFIKPLLEDVPALPKAANRSVAIARAQNAVCRVSIGH